jgi:DNA-binding transcriptional LysR family regulator
MVVDDPEQYQLRLPCCFSNEPRSSVVSAQAELAIETARRAAKGEIGRLSIGFLGSATSAFLPELVRKFKVKYPGVKLTLQELTPVQQDPAFEKGEIDIGFTRTLTAEQNLLIAGFVPRSVDGCAAAFTTPEEQARAY